MKKKPDARGKAPTPRSRPIAQRGIMTVDDFAAFSAALLADLSTGSIAPQVANAMSNVSGKLLKAREMEEKYGRVREHGKGKTLILAPAARLIASGGPSA